MEPTVNALHVLVCTASVPVCTWYILLLKARFLIPDLQFPTTDLPLSFLWMQSVTHKTAFTWNLSPPSMYLSGAVSTGMYWYVPQFEVYVLVCICYVYGMYWYPPAADPGSENKGDYYAP